jgi:hypothetical protein
MARKMQSNVAIKAIQDVELKSIVKGQGLRQEQKGEEIFIKDDNRELFFFFLLLFANLTTVAIPTANHQPALRGRFQLLLNSLLHLQWYSRCLC